jgi:hypothetical protein
VSTISAKQSEVIGNTTLAVQSPSLTVTTARLAERDGRRGLFGNSGGEWRHSAVHLINCQRDHCLAA